MNLITISIVCAILLAALIIYDIGKRSRWTALFLFAYVVTTASLAFTGVFTRHSKGFPPLAINVMTAFLFTMILLLFVPSIRKSLLSIPTKRLVVWHWVRLPVGIVFLKLAESGELSPMFGQIVGWGDAIIGAWAIAYVMVPILNRPLGTSIWNAAAFADMIAGVCVATMILASTREDFIAAQPMEIMSAFPLAFVPGFAVPMLLVTNFLIWRQIRMEMGCCPKKSDHKSAKLTPQLEQITSHH